MYIVFPIQNLNTSTLGQSPVAHGFLQTLQSPFSTSLSYNTPLGPLSPFSAPQSLQSSFGVQTTPTSPLTSAAMSPVPGQSRVMTMAQIVTQSSGGGMKAPSSPQRPTTMVCLLLINMILNQFLLTRVLYIYICGCVCVSSVLP